MAILNSTLLAYQVGYLCVLIFENSVHKYVSMWIYIYSVPKGCFPLLFRTGGALGFPLDMQRAPRMDPEPWPATSNRLGGQCGSPAVQGCFQPTVLKNNGCVVYPLCQKGMDKKEGNPC